jgi:gluconolactonase
MRTTGLLAAVALATVGAISVLAQQAQPADPQRTPGVQAGQDPNRAAFIMANCKTPPPAPAGRGGGGAPGGGAPAASIAPKLADVSSTAIPGVIAAGQKWQLVWEDKGNNADGPVGMDDGSLWLAQNDKSDVVRIDRNGKAEVIYKDTYTGGSIAANKKGEVFVAERALHPAIWYLKPQRKLFANSYKGEPFDCLGAGVLNDMSADSKGGVYFTMGGVYYANPKGEVMGRFGTVGGNGIILSPDEKTLYVTGRLMGTTPPAAVEGNGGLVAFDVKPDGALTNERQFAWYGGDGSSVDKDGRIYTTTGGPGGGVAVISQKGDLLGMIPVPRGLISVTFGGTDKKTLYGVSIRDVQIFKIPMIAQGMKGRPK